MQGPAQYQQYQQSRKDQQMNQMLQMMMQMRAFKQRQKQFEVGQETSRRKEDWQKQYQQQYMDYQKFQMDPAAQHAMSKARAMGTAEGRGPELEKPRAILPTPIKTWLQTDAGGGWTEEQLGGLDDATKRALINDWRNSRKPETADKPPTSQTVFLNKINTSIDRQISRIAKNTGGITNFNPFKGGFDSTWEGGQEPSTVVFLRNAKGIVGEWVNVTTERKLSKEEMGRARQAHTFFNNLHKNEDAIASILEADPSASVWEVMEFLSTRR